MVFSSYERTNGTANGHIEHPNEAANSYPTLNYSAVQSAGEEPDIYIVTFILGSDITQSHVVR